ncbi:protein Atg16l2 [Pseudophryne corroboree]|uniref:protein Atg16l2 n=1 Tax=Pseudophryne corroboree TaxID=495146 RepID=UPI003081E0AB
MQQRRRREDLGSGTVAAWKTDIIRQLRHRDLCQHRRFQELVLSYNKLLERSIFLKDLTEQIQTDPLSSPNSHHVARVPPCVSHSPGPQDLPKLQKEIADLKNTNGELALEAYELKKQIQDREEQLKEQHDSITLMSELLEGRKLKQQCLQNDVLQMICANAEMKEEYDRLLSQRLLVETKLPEAELEQREHVETLTKKKALEAEQQNNLNQRRTKAIWTRAVKDALKKTISAEGDLHCKVRADTFDCSSEHSASSSEEEPQSGRKDRKNRSQSMIVSSKLMGTIKSFFDFRKEPATSCAEVEWGYRSRVCVICSPPQRSLYSEEIHESEIDAVKFSPNSKMLATGGADRVVKIWDIVGARLQRQQVLEGSNGGITSIEFDPSGLQVLASSYDGSAILWRLGNKSSVTLTGHKKKVTAAKFKMTAYQAVTGSMDRTVREWDLQKGAGIRCIPVSSYCSDVVCLDSCVISGHHDKKIRFWDSRSKTCTREVTLEEKITSLCVDQDQTQLLSCSRDDVLRLMDLRTGNVCQEFRDDGFKCGCDWTKAILSPDASYSIAGSADGTVFVWNTRTGLLERSLTGEHSAPVNAVAWSASGDYVVSVDRGKKAVLWTQY